MKPAIEALNKDFELATPDKKRVMIAQDVIKFLDADKITPVEGTYFGIEEISSKELEKAIIHEDLQLHELLAKTKGCNLCAIGAVFYSAVVNHDNIKVSEVCDIRYLDQDGLYLNSYELIAYLEKFFSRRTLRLMEVAFEGDIVEDLFDDSDEDLIERAQNIFHAYLNDPKERMRVIMKNIIENNGNFIP